MNSESNCPPSEATIPHHESSIESHSKKEVGDSHDATTRVELHEPSSTPSQPSSSVSTTAAVLLEKADNPLDQGHRFGNFHNYYAFHPPSARIDALKDIIEYISSSWNPSPPEKQVKREPSSSSPLRNFPFTYLDVGCNEGDLTMEVAHSLQAKLGGMTAIDVTGVDIDAVLITRANQKYNRGQVEGISSTMIQAQFQVADACSTDQLNQVALPSTTIHNNTTTTTTTGSSSMFDLITLFSTTMWIHVHVGDQGLAKVLQHLCQMTRHFLIIEPQPSKCYRNAVVRLRKLGRPELDVSTNRLAFRSNVATAIDDIVTKCGFRRVEWKEELHSTCWNRSLQLYERVTPTSEDPRET